jgi:hypothetical protein
MSFRSSLRTELSQWILAVVFVIGGLMLWRLTSRVQAAVVADKVLVAPGFGSTCPAN